MWVLKSEKRTLTSKSAVSQRSAARCKNLNTNVGQENKKLEKSLEQVKKIRKAFQSLGSVLGTDA